jgi:hypothetical protein
MRAMDAYVLLLVPESQVETAGDGKASIVTMDTGWRRLTGPFKVIADVPADGSLCMSRMLYDTIKVVDP